MHEMRAVRHCSGEQPAGSIARLLAARSSGQRAAAAGIFDAADQCSTKAQLFALVFCLLIRAHRRTKAFGYLFAAISTTNMILKLADATIVQRCRVLIELRTFVRQRTCTSARCVLIPRIAVLLEERENIALRCH